MDESKAFQQRVGRIEGLLQQLESAGDPILRRSARELVEALMELHGAALERILEVVADGAEAGGPLMGVFGSDPLISSLLVLYGLHPEDLETRVRRGLEGVRTVLQRESAHWEGLQIDGNTVRLKIIGSQDAVAARKLEGVVREALLESAPDASEVHITGSAIGGGGGVSTAGFVPLTRLRSADGSPVVTAAAQLMKTDS